MTRNSVLLFIILPQETTTIGLFFTCFLPSKHSFQRVTELCQAISLKLGGGVNQLLGHLPYDFRSDRAPQGGASPPNVKNELFWTLFQTLTAPLYEFSRTCAKNHSKEEETLFPTDTEIRKSNEGVFRYSAPKSDDIYFGVFFFALKIGVPRTFLTIPPS